MPNGTERMLMQLHLAENTDMYNAKAGKPINAAMGSHTTFIVNEGTGGTGTGVIVVNSYDDAAKTNPVAINFKVREQHSASTSDAFALPLADVSAAGYTTLAGAQKLIFVEVNHRDLPTGKKFFAIETTTGAAGACVGSIVALVLEPYWIGGGSETVNS